MFYLALLSIICFGIATFSFFYFKRNVLSPTTVISFLFGLSSLCSIASLQKISATFSGNTVGVVAGSISCLFFGEFFSQKIADKFPATHYLFFEDSPHSFKRCEQKTTSVCSEKIVFRWYILLGLILFSLLTFALYLYGDYQIVKLSSNGSVPSSLSGFYSALRKARNDGYSVASYIQHFFSAAHAIALIATFVFSFNIYHQVTFNKNWPYLLPIIIYLGTAVLTSGRTAIEDFLISICVIVFFNFHFSDQIENKRMKNKTILFALSVLIIFVLSFIVLGALRGSLFSGANQLEMLIFYFCSPLLALDQYLQNPFLNSTGLFGVHCFNGIYGALHSLFPNSIPVVNMPLEFTYFNAGTISTNIYTAIRRYIEDFNFFSPLVIVLFSFIYSFSISRAKKNKSPFQILVLSACYYPVFEFVIEERMLNEILSLSTFFVVLYLFLLYLLLFEGFLETERPAPFFHSDFHEE
jgi:oligosaccharide repeat unit polymerase